MKNACLYLLIIVTAGYATGLCELAKIPAFISHYKEHRANATAAGLGEFIAMHYLGQDKKDNDLQKDAALPFKHQSSKRLVYAVPPNDYPVTFPIKYTITKVVTPYRAAHWPDAIALAFFRPPCTANC